MFASFDGTKAKPSRYPLSTALLFLRHECKRAVTIKPMAIGAVEFKASTQQLRLLRHVRRDPPRLVFDEQLRRRSAASGINN
jgi:hypothetical protein